MHLASLLLVFVVSGATGRYCEACYRLLLTAATLVLVAFKSEKLSYRKETALLIVAGTLLFPNVWKLERLQTA